MAVVLGRPGLTGLGRPDTARALRVAVFRGLRGIGDMLVAGPALRMLRAALPDARIALIGVEEALPALSRMRELFDEFVEFPGWPGLPEGGGTSHSSNHSGKRRRRPLPREHAADVQDWCGSDAVVQMHGDGSLSNGFCASLKPSALFAYGPAVTRGASALHTSPYPRQMHEIDRCLALCVRAAKVLGGTVGPLDRSLEFPITGDDRREARGLLRGVAVPDGPYYVLHPGAHLADRRWPADRFAAVGRVLAEHAPVVVTGATSEDALAHHVAHLIGPRAVSVSGATTLGSMAALIAGARGVVTNDTGVSHLADATRTRSVVVFMASDPHRWAPLDRSLHVPVVRPVVEGDGGLLTPEGLRLATPEVASVLGAIASAGMTKGDA